MCEYIIPCCQCGRKEGRKEGRFANDKCFYEDDNCILIADGLLLNKSELLSEQGSSEYSDILKKVLDDKNYIKKLRGCFTGFVYDKKRKKGYAYGNQIGDASVFYHFDNETRKLIISNNFNELHKLVDKRHLSLNEQSAHYLLTYGYIIDDNTICSGIKRLRAGKLLAIEDNSIQVEIYHRFSFNPTCKLGHDEILSEIDRLFRQSVKRSFDKDLEYGYTEHLVDLSAGLDSRIINVIAKDMGYDKIVNISYSQSSSSEEKYTQKVANKLKNPYYHKSLDDAGFVYNIESMTEETFGAAYYFAISGGQQLLRLINFDNFGCEFTGWLGGESIGGLHFGTGPKINYNTGRHSNTVKLRLGGGIEKYVDQEEFNFYTRQAQDILNTAYLRTYYTYPMSPFMDVDFLQFCYSIPYKMRDNHKLYWAWLDKYYPEWASLPSSTIRFSKNFGDIYRWFRLRFRYVARFIARNLGIKRFSYKKDHMKPFDLWYHTNSNLRDFVKSYYENNAKLIASSNELSHECSLLFKSKNITDKLMAISMLSAVKRYCS
jgi:asparagine synthase (glutamine-hydrolysing)